MYYKLLGIVSCAILWKTADYYLCKSKNQTSIIFSPYESLMRFNGKNKHIKKYPKIILANIHALSTLLLERNMLYFTTCGYFLHDTIDLWFRKNQYSLMMKIMYTIHHLGANLIIMLMNYFPPSIIDLCFKLIYYAEFTNLFVYAVYYLLHSDYKDSDITTIMIIIETFVYSFFRGILITQGMYNVFQNVLVNGNDVSITLCWVAGIIQLMVFGWIVTIIKKMIKRLETHPITIN